MLFLRCISLLFVTSVGVWRIRCSIRDRPRNTCLSSMLTSLPLRILPADTVFSLFLPPPDLFKDRALKWGGGLVWHNHRIMILLPCFALYVSSNVFELEVDTLAHCHCQPHSKDEIMESDETKIDAGNLTLSSHPHGRAASGHNKNGKFLLND